MNINITYPKRNIKLSKFNRFIGAIGYSLLGICIVSIILNIILKGKPWSLIESIIIYMIWRFIISPFLIERNFIDTFSRLIFFLSLLFVSFDLFFEGGWSKVFLPILISDLLIIPFILILINYKKNQYNEFPFIFILILSIIFSIFGLSLDFFNEKWVFVILLVESIFFISVLIIKAGRKLLKEFVKRTSLK